MTANTLLKQKKEKTETLLRQYIPREKIPWAKKLLDNKLIKVISGPRRAGKSVFSFLLLKDKNFAYVNFDDEDLLNIKNTDEILKGIFEIYKNPEFILFDEIQNLNNWELFVNKLQRRNYRIIVTGSNAKLLSKELATHLTGRHVAIEIFPFSFKEFLQAKNFSFTKQEINLPEVKGQMLNLLKDYLQKGGFPEIISENMNADIYLKTLYDSLLLKDIIKRYNIRFSQKLYDLARYIINNFASEVSFNKLKNILSFNSVHTIQNYIQYLEETFLFFLLERYSPKTKEQLKSPQKAYIVDNGYIHAIASMSSTNTGKLLENMVFYELLKAGYKPNQNIFYYKTRNGKEVDFILKDGLKIISLFQVCYELNIDTEKRELNSLIEASEELRCNNLNILTWDTERIIKIKKKQIKILPVWKLLLGGFK